MEKHPRPAPVLMEQGVAAFYRNEEKRSRKKSNSCVALHSAIIQRTMVTPHDYKICTP